jgi:hypothetical protein
MVRLMGLTVRAHDVIGFHLGMQVHKRCSSEEVTMMKQLYAIEANSSKIYDDVVEAFSWFA